jgi:hypothetical protein
MKEMPKMYVIVRNDLRSSQKAVQAGHALAEWMLHDNTSWKNHTLIYLTARNRFHLEMISDILDDKEIKHVQFNEPDFNDEITAIATFGNNDVFKKLPLLR